MKSFSAQAMRDRMNPERGLLRRVRATSKSGGTMFCAYELYAQLCQENGEMPDPRLDMHYGVVIRKGEEVRQCDQFGNVFDVVDGALMYVTGDNEKGW